MITREQLEEIGFLSPDNTLYYDTGMWDYEYNVKTQKLFSHCEVDGDTEFIARVTDIEKFKEIIEIYK
jgi:pectin methylesterase-like acyl-CoA thioesterase